MASPDKTPKPGENANKLGSTLGNAANNVPVVNNAQEKIDEGKREIKAGVDTVEAVGAAAAGNWVGAIKKAYDALKNIKMEDIWKFATMHWRIIGYAVAFLIFMFEFAYMMIAAGGSGGKTAAISVAAGDSDVKAVLDLAKKQASWKGQNISGFTAVNFSTKRDLDYLQNIYSNGTDSKYNTRFDKRLARTIEYLAGLHSFIDISHIVSAYEDVPIDTENTTNPQVIANISAHKNGQAMDVDKIDFIFKAMNPLSKCGTSPSDPRRDLIWFNDRSQQLLVQKCKGYIFSLMKGGPIINGLPTSAIPIEVKWQDNPPTLNKSTANSTRAAGMSQIENALKLPPGALSNKVQNTVNGQLANIGLSEVALQIGLDPDQMIGQTVDKIFQRIGQTEAENQLQLPRNSLNNTSSADSMSISAGDAVLAEAFGLTSIGFKGGRETLPDMAEQAGAAKLETELGLAAGSLTTPTTVKTSFEQARITQDQMVEAASTFRLPQEQMINLYTGAMSGTINQNALTIVGALFLERAWSMPEGTLTPYLQQIAVVGAAKTTLPDLATKTQGDWANLESKPSIPLPPGSLTDLVSRLGKGEDVSKIIKSLGANQLDRGFYLQGGSVAAMSSGTTWNPVTMLLAGNGTEELAKTVFGGGNVLNYLGQSGKTLYTNQLLANSPAARNIVLDQSMITQLIADPISGATTVGMNLLQQNTGLSATQINQVLGGDLRNNPKVLQVLSSGLNLSTGDVQVLLNSGDPTKLNAAKQVLVKGLNISDSDAQIIISGGDPRQLSLTQSSLAQYTGLPTSTINMLVSGQVMNIPALQNGLKNDLHLNDADLNNLINGKWNNVPILTQTLTKDFGVSADQINILYGENNWDNLAVVRQAEQKVWGLSNGDAEKLMKGDWQNADFVRTGLQKYLKVSPQQLSNILDGNWSNIPILNNTLTTKFGIGSGEINNLLGGNFSSIPLLGNLDSALGLNAGTLSGALNGWGASGTLGNLGLATGTGLPLVGNDDAEVMAKVKRPEAQYKVHQVIGELLDMPKKLNDMNMRITQLITFSQDRDVTPFKDKLDALYGVSRNNNYGLFSMPEAIPSIHIGY